MRFRAHVQEDFQRASVRLLIVQDVGNGVDVLMGNGSWQHHEPGVMWADDHGIELPHDALPALAEALQKHLGNALPSQAEVAVLREVLTKEQLRVDAVLADAVLVPKRAS
jgi:hypothetical protein